MKRILLEQNEENLITTSVLSFPSCFEPSIVMYSVILALIIVQVELNLISLSLFVYFIMIKYIIEIVEFETLAKFYSLSGCGA